MEGSKRPATVCGFALSRWHGLLASSGWADIEAILTAVGTGKLAVDEYGGSGILAARGLRVGWNDAVRERIDGSAFVAGKEHPGTWQSSRWRITSVWCPG